MSTLRRTEMKRTEFKRKPKKRGPIASEVIRCDRWKPRSGKLYRCSKQGTVIVSENERYCAADALEMADRLTGNYVKARDGACVACGTTAGLDWAHIRSRGARAIRWLVEPAPGNSVALCRADHYRFTIAPAKWDLFVEEKWPGQYTRLVLEEAQMLKSGTKGPKPVDIIRRERFRGEVG